MKRIIFTLLSLISLCCTAQAQDADITENLMFTPANSCLVGFPAGTRMTLYDYPRVGVDLGSDGIDVSTIKTLGVVFTENLVSNNLISFCFMTQPNGTDGQKSSSNLCLKGKYKTGL